MIRRLSKLVVMAAGIAVVAASCAPGGGPPNVPIVVGAGSQVTTQVVDQINDVGRSPSVGLNKDGSPAVAYLLVKPVLKKGAIPPPIIANTPQPPSVVLATEQGGIWSRRGVTPNKQPDGAPGTATEIADAKGHYLPGVTVALAVDADGRHHVVWSTPSGLYYSVDQSVAAGQQTVLVFPDKPTQITTLPAAGASIVVSADGTPSIAFDQDGQVKVATQKGSAWEVKSVTHSTAQLSVCVGCTPQRTAVAETPSGDTLVAFTENSNVMLATGKAGTWTTEQVSSSGGTGLSIALSSLGQPYLAYYQTDGTVQVAGKNADGTWARAQVGKAGPAPTGQAAQAWTTGIGITTQGQIWVAWADTTGGQIGVAVGLSGSSLSLTPHGVPQSSGGWSPSLAVAPDGKHVALAWFDSVNKHLMVAVRNSDVGGLAVPSPSFSPLPTPPASGAPPCSPTAGQATLNIAAKTLAFDTTCLAVTSDTAFQLAFVNQDSGTPHNVEIYTDSSATTRLGGATGPTDTIIGPSQTTYKVDPLPAGVYYFKCDVHPTMNGTFVVAKAA